MWQMAPPATRSRGQLTERAGIVSLDIQDSAPAASGEPSALGSSAASISGSKSMVGRHMLRIGGDRQREMRQGVSAGPDLADASASLLAALSAHCVGMLGPIPASCEGWEPFWRRQK